MAKVFDDKVSEKMRYLISPFPKLVPTKYYTRKTNLNPNILLFFLVFETLFP